MDFRIMREDELQSWYDLELTEAFPPHERKPLAVIRELIASGRYTLWGLYDNDVLLGYAGLWGKPGAGYVLLDYLGVTAARRSGGFGAQILRLLNQQEKNRIIIESECPLASADEAENAIRARRIGFYERAGYRGRYEMAACGSRFQAMSLDGPEDVPAMMAAHWAVYDSGRPDVKIPLGPDEAPPPAFWGNEA